MEVYKPLRALLALYDLGRVLFLAASFALFSSVQEAVGTGGLPYAAYLSSNSLFPLIGFFLFLRPAEYRNYLPLYAAGKAIAVVLFYVWAFFYVSGATAAGISVEDVVLFAAAFFISLGDLFSVFGAFILHKKLPRAE